MDAPNVRNPALTVQKILVAAEKEFGTKGFDGAKIDHIARQIGISKQLIYYYFKSKEELYSELLTRNAQASNNRLLQIDYEVLDPEAAIRAFVAAIYDEYVGHPVTAVMTLDQSLHGGAHIRRHPETQRSLEQLKNRIKQVLERGKHAGVIGPDIDAEGLHFMTVIITTGCVASRSMFNRLQGHAQDNQEQTEFWRAYAISFIMRAIRI